MRVDDQVDGYLTLIQQDHRHFLETDYEYSLVRVIVMRIDKNTR